MIATESVKVSAINIPENITTYFIQSNPFHKKYKPPKVSTTEKKGSIIKKSFAFLLSFVMLKMSPTKKKIIDMDNIWL